MGALVSVKVKAADHEVPESLGVSGAGQVLGIQGHLVSAGLAVEAEQPFGGSAAALV